MTADATHGPGIKRMVGRRLVCNCASCGQPWPCDGSWQARAETAEAKLAAIRVLLGDWTCLPAQVPVLEIEAMVKAARKRRSRVTATLTATENTDSSGPQ